MNGQPRFLIYINTPDLQDFQFCSSMEEVVEFIASEMPYLEGEGWSDHVRVFEVGREFAIMVNKSPSEIVN